jgi:hypothetical protein
MVGEKPPELGISISELVSSFESIRSQGVEMQRGLKAESKHESSNETTFGNRIEDEIKMPACIHLII